MNRPHILYLHSHDTGRYIQPYGYAVDTPALQRFAEQGVLFRNAFCAAPTCSPSRAALLTGQYPHQNGMTALAHRGGRLLDPARHLANYLKGQGYATALSGAQHVTPDDHLEGIRLLGYDRALSQESTPEGVKDAESRNDWYAQAAADYLLKAGQDRPFFLDCGFTLTHRVGTGEQWHTTRNAPAGDPRYVRAPALLPDTPETRRDFADFRVAARHLDACMGRVLGALDQAGLAERTLVLITTDHGIAYPRMKCNLTGHGTGVMLMMRQAGVFTGGQVLDGLASHIDVFPTLCEAAGLARPAGLEGVSLVPLTTGLASVREEAFAEVNWHAAAEPMRSVRTPRYNYIRRFAPHTGPVLSNCDDSITKSLLRRAGWDRPQVSEELYDLYFDPQEACNLAADPACAATLADLRGRLKTWMEHTGDPLLTGRIEPWPGGRSQRVTDESPQGAWVPTEAIIVPAVLGTA